jgi:hypothetical protein
MSRRPQVVVATPDPVFVASLPDCDFADAFSVTVPRHPDHGSRHP